MTPRALEEYSALRSTIRERGTTRVWIFLAGLTGWAALTVATAALAELPVATLLPLLILAATFEAVFALHTGVERIGRYIQVFMEDDGPERGWEHHVMAFARAYPGRGTDPLFTLYFTVATLFNFVPVILAGAVPIEYGVVGAIHVLFILHLWLAHRRAGRQRAIDLEGFQQIKAGARG
jgi:hypothetical protein